MMRMAEENPALHILPAFPVDCTLMMDTVHLNRKGGEQFSMYLHEQIERAMSRESAEGESADGL
jgi:hypothetical protein